jgi:hypothetical protein
MGAGTAIQRYCVKWYTATVDRLWSRIEPIDRPTARVILVSLYQFGMPKSGSPAGRPARRPRRVPLH